MKKITTATILILCLYTSSIHAQHLTNAGKIEKITSAAIQKAFHSSVKISPYDTIRNVPGNGVFSGVVVTAEGHVLTAAHASKPKQIYQLTFPDGKKALARGLGRIAVKNKEYSMDLAMIKIIAKGTWPFAELGSSAGMKIHQPAISISFPGSFPHKIPNVRVGRITNVDFEDGFFESTCKMEPGDSGGPLFDANGRLLGIHSFIKAGEDNNYEVAVDLYRRFWSALNVAEDYKVLPEPNPIPSDPLPKNNFTFPHIQDITRVPIKLVNTACRLKSNVNGDFTRTMATIVSYNATNYLISKSSAVGDTVLYLDKTQWQPLKVIARDEENDLVLLQAQLTNGEAIPLKSGGDTLEVKFEHLGRFLISNLDKGRQYVSSLGSRYVALPKPRSNFGYFGANATFINEKITITDIARNSPASAHVHLKDQVTAVNGKTISQPEHYGAEFSKYKPGDSITVDVIREGKPLQFKLRLTEGGSGMGNHIADRFDGGKSLRSTGFNKILIHDAAIFPEDCGGPVFDARGQFYGINIARHSRTSTLIMPEPLITAFIEKHIKD